MTETERPVGPEMWGPSTAFFLNWKVRSPSEEEEAVLLLLKLVNVGCGKVFEGKIGSGEKY